MGHVAVALPCHGRIVPGPLVYHAGMSPSLNDVAARLEVEARAYQQSAVLLAAVEVGLLDELAKGPRTREELASGLRCSVRGISSLANALVAAGWLRHDGPRYRLPEELRGPVVDGGPDSIAAMLRHHAVLMRRWAHLADSVRSGEPVPREPRSPARQTAFLQAMDDLARRHAQQLWDTVPLDGRTRLLDIGGGGGRFALEAVRRFPELEAVVVDLAESEQAFEAVTRDERERPRIRFAAGDAFNDPLPEGDAALVSSLVHSYGPAEITRLARRLAGALPAGGLVVIREFLFDNDDHTSPRSATLFALNMLVNSAAGGCYSARELEELLTPEWFEGWQLHRIDERTSIMVGRRSSRPLEG